MRRPGVLLALLGGMAAVMLTFACGATLVRDGGHVLRDAFDITPEHATATVTVRF